MRVKKFSDVKEGNQFVYKNCLFTKTSENTAKMQGAKDFTKISKDEQVGVVVSGAQAPEQTTGQEEVKPTESEDNAS